MLLKRSRIFIPGVIFAAISIGFWIIQLRFFDVIGWNYNACHALFGFAFPLFLSHLGFFSRANLKKPQLLQVVRQVLAIPFLSWPLSFLRLVGRSFARDFNEGIPWTPWVGVAITLFFSIGNEMLIDPVTNGIPFIHAYEHFVADLSGMAAFLLVTWPVVRNNRYSVANQLALASRDQI
jgi:hypothetical protein